MFRKILVRFISRTDIFSSSFVRNGSGA